MPADSITLDPTIIGTMDKASRKVLDAEQKHEEEEALRKKEANRKKKNKTRGRSSIGEKQKKREGVHDEKTRAKIAEVMNNKLKMKRLEKKKQMQERHMIEDSDLLNEFDPV